MRLLSLGSGSKGNATLVESADTCLLIDCGFSLVELTRRMAAVGRHPDQLTAVLVTHEHSDHCRGVAVLGRRYPLPLYMTSGTARAAELGDQACLQVIDSHRDFEVGGITVTPVPVPHDAREPVQFVFRRQRKTLGVLTDLGSVTAHVVESYKDCDGLLLEANHDLEMLAQGPYPYVLKQRVGSDWGHLNNGQAARLLDAVGVERLQGIVIGHMSEQNNRLDQVRAEIEPLLEVVPAVQYAEQSAPGDWLSVE